MSRTVCYILLIGRRVGSFSTSAPFTLTRQNLPQFQFTGQRASDHGDGRRMNVQLEGPQRSSETINLPVRLTQAVAKRGNLESAGRARMVVADISLESSHEVSSPKLLDQTEPFHSDENVSPSLSRGRFRVSRRSSVSSKPPQFLPLHLDRRIRSKSLGRIPRKEDQAMKTMKGEEEAIQRRPVEVTVEEKDEHQDVGRESMFSANQPENCKSQRSTDILELGGSGSPSKTHHRYLGLDLSSPVRSLNYSLARVSLKSDDYLPLRSPLNNRNPAVESDHLTNGNLAPKASPDFDEATSVPEKQLAGPSTPKFRANLMSEVLSPLGRHRPDNSLSPPTPELAESCSSNSSTPTSVGISDAARFTRNVMGKDSALSLLLPVEDADRKDAPSHNQYCARQAQSQQPCSVENSEETVVEPRSNHLTARPTTIRGHSFDTVPDAEDETGQDPIAREGKNVGKSPKRRSRKGKSQKKRKNGPSSDTKPESPILVKPMLCAEPGLSPSMTKVRPLKGRILPVEAEFSELSELELDQAPVSEQTPQQSVPVEVVQGETLFVQECKDTKESSLSVDNLQEVLKGKPRLGRKPRPHGRQPEADNDDSSDVRIELVKDIEAEDVAKEALRVAVSPIRPSTVRGMSFGDDDPVEAIKPSRPRIGRKPRPSCVPPTGGTAFEAFQKPTLDDSKDGLLKPLPKNTTSPALTEKEPGWTKAKLKSTLPSDPAEKEKFLAWKKPAWSINRCRDLKLQRQSEDEPTEVSESVTEPQEKTS